MSSVTVMEAQRDSQRQRGGGERRGVMAARRALAARSVRTRRPALKMESTAGVRLRLESTIHSKFVFSRNRWAASVHRIGYPNVQRPATCGNWSKCMIEPRLRTYRRPALM